MNDRAVIERYTTRDGYAGISNARKSFESAELTFTLCWSKSWRYGACLYVMERNPGNKGGKTIEAGTCDLS